MYALEKLFVVYSVNYAKKKSEKKTNIITVCEFTHLFYVCRDVVN